MKFPRLTVRWLMVAVLASALPIWWFVGRPAWFERVADRHYEQYLATMTDHEERYGDRTMIVSYVTMEGEWHLIMSLRYRHAAKYYWKPLGTGSN